MTPGEPDIPSIPPGMRASLGDLPDLLLVDRARAGDARAFEALMRRYNRRLFRTARGVLKDADAAEDAVQEAYLSAFTHLDRYEPTGRFGAWLTRIALNEALMLRRKTRRNDVSFDQLDDAALTVEENAITESEPQADYAETMQARELLEAAIDALPDPFRVVFVLRMVEQLSINETAISLGLNEATVRTRLHRAQRILRTDLSHRLGREKLNVFDFGASRCDRLVDTVLTRLRNTTLPGELKP
jgi:RNA polymerase sigma-70 factor (ECF subfamily)